MENKKAIKHSILIGGELRESSDLLEVRSPFGGEVVGTTHLASMEMAEEALALAKASFKATREMSAHDRSEVLRRIVEGLSARSDELARVISNEAGKPINDARAEVNRAKITFQVAAEEAGRIGGEVLDLDTVEGADGRTGITRRFPVGVVLAITPFNFPLNLVAHKVAPAIACGCPVIVKPAPATPLTALILGEIIVKAGYPKGAISVVPCANDVAESMLTDDRVKKLTFTGSVGVGWHLKGLVNKKRVTLELGGNAAVIVDEGTDIENAAARCVLGAFAYAGQVCISVQRIYVHETIFEEFKDLFIKKTEALKVGDPMDETNDLGPLINEASAIRAEKMITDAVKAGAKLLTGGGRKGNTITPTVLTNSNASMSVASEEAFAPVVTVEPFTDFDEALEEVNNSRFGLQAGVFTGDKDKAFRAYNLLDVGGVIIDDIPGFRVDSMPYGGVKDSGFGREGIKYAISEMTELKLLVIKT